MYINNTKQNIVLNYKFLQHIIYAIDMAQLIGKMFRKTFFVIYGDIYHLQHQNKNYI